MTHIPPTGKIHYLPPTVAGLGSCGCCNEMLQNGRLNTTELYSFIVREATSVQSRCRQHHAPAATPREGSFPAFSLSRGLRCSLVDGSLVLTALPSLGCFPSSASLSSRARSSSCLSSASEDTRHAGLRSHPIPA